jgi:hypothetical protein
MHISGQDHREKVLVMLIKIVFKEENSFFDCLRDSFSF